MRRVRGRAWGCPPKTRTRKAAPRHCVLCSCEQVGRRPCIVEEPKQGRRLPSSTISEAGKASRPYVTTLSATVSYERNLPAPGLNQVRLARPVRAREQEC
jgi:hypothetical protein